MLVMNHNKMGFTVFTIGFVFAFLKFACCERLHEQIYSSIEGGAACFRRLNGTHQAGCASSDKGAVGVVHMISTTGDAQWLAYNASAGPYVAVVSTSLFYEVVELLIGRPENVAGVLIYDSAITKAKSFSQESRCPNEYSSGPGSQCSSSQAGGIVWNEQGTGLLRRDIPFPMFFLPQTRYEEIDKIENCFKRYNLDLDNQQGKPLCSIQLNSFMFAAVNTVVCLRRSASSALMSSTKVCDPLGDNNVYYSLFPRGTETSTTKKPVTLITARIDTASLFDGIAPGAASSVVGMVTLITTAAALAAMIPVSDSKSYDNNVLWTLLNGESFDYIGSQRVAHDLARGAWPPGAPLAPADVRLHVELGQIGGALLGHSDDTSWPMYAYAPTNDFSEINDFLQEIKAHFNENNMTLEPKFTTNFPPSSLHSFRRILKNVTESGELPEVLLVDHEGAFPNMFYQSALDEYDKIGFVYHNISIGSNGTFLSTAELIANGTMKETECQVKISKLATALARALYQKVAGRPYAGNVSASAHLVDEMLFCFLRSQTCRLLMAADYMQEGGEAAALPERPPQLYVGVAAWSGAPAVFAGHLLALLAGAQLPDNRTACAARQHADFSYYWLRGWNRSGVCIETTMNFSQAVSPAFTTPDYDYTSGEYSTWTESVWQAMSARVFVSAGGGGARLAALAGGAAVLLVGFLTHWLKRHAARVFAEDLAFNVDDDVAAGILRTTINC